MQHERSAANALLKNLEEPPANSLFLLVSHAPERLLPTIRSRCRVIRLSPLRSDVMASALRAGGRLVGPASVAVTAGVQELARDDRQWVGVKRDVTSRLVTIGQRR